MKNAKTVFPMEKGPSHFLEMASPPGFEPGASGLGGLRSIQLSYGDGYPIIIPQIRNKIKLNEKEKRCIL